MQSFFLKHDSRVLHSTGIYHALPLQKKKHHTYNVMHYTLHVPVLSTGMNLLSKFCIAVSATGKLNCVAVGVICVAVFFGVLEKKILELRDAFPAQPVQAILKKRDSPSAAAMK